MLAPLRCAGFTGCMTIFSIEPAPRLLRNRTDRVACLSITNRLSGFVNMITWRETDAEVGGDGDDDGEEASQGAHARQ